jgi:hypothetical protein
VTDATLTWKAHRKLIGSARHVRLTFLNPWKLRRTLLQNYRLVQIAGNAMLFDGLQLFENAILHRGIMHQRKSTKVLKLQFCVYASRFHPDY